MTLTGLVFLLGFATGCALAFVRHPIYGLITYIGVFYLSPTDRWWGQTIPDLRWSLTISAITFLATFVGSRPAPTIPFFRHAVVGGLIGFLAWLTLQILWALDRNLQLELWVLFAKYLVLLAIIYRSLDSEKHLRMFLWAHVCGCLYLGWIAYSEYSGGRFEGFGGPNINEANAGALQIATGVLTASALFLMSRWRERAVLFGFMPFILNALVTTVSRSGFLAIAAGGLVFNLFTPKRFSKRVKVLSILAVVLFGLLTNAAYLARIGTIKLAGEDVEGVDTGGGRLELMEAQWRMFQEYPWGCGHRCTAVLSPGFLDDRFLTGSEEGRARSSHSTYMTMLVEHGVPGVVFHLMLLGWMLSALRRLKRLPGPDGSAMPVILAAVAASFAAIVVGDFFVDYLKMEVRLWFISIVMVMLNLTAAESRRVASAALTAAQPVPALGGTVTKRVRSLKEPFAN